MPVKCEGCGHIYTLGKDSVVVSTGQPIFDMLVVIVLRGKPPINSPEEPDLIDQFPPETKRNFDSLTLAQQHDQQIQINKISSSLSSNTPRWWRCRKCGTIQIYKRTI
jgi:rubredoxin